MTIHPSISVVIPTFNRSKRTLEAIESALEQTLRPLEVIVVDDHSTDDTVERVTSRFGHIVRLIILDQNVGGASARNAGARTAQGTYIAFLDSDDIWRKDKLQVQYLHYLSSAPENAPAIAYCRADIDWTVHGKTYCPERGLAINEKVEDYVMLHEQDIQTSGLFMPLRVFNMIRFKERLARHQDIDFVIRAQQLGVKFIYADNSLYLRRRDDTNRNIGRIRNDDVSFNWIVSIRPFIESRAYHRFMWNRVMPQIAPRIPLKAFLYAFPAQLAGEQAFAKLAQILLRSIRLRWNRFAARFAGVLSRS